MELPPNLSNEFSEPEKKVVFPESDLCACMCVCVNNRKSQGTETLVPPGGLY